MSAERIFGYRAEEIIGQSIVQLLPSGRKEEETAILNRVREGERVDHFETQRQRKDGELIDVSVTVSPIRDPDNRIIGASKVARDITEQKRIGRAARLLAAIVDSSDDAIVSKDLNGIITSWNASAQRIFGYTAEEAIGRAVLMLVPKNRQDEEPAILAKLRRGERVDHFETIRVRKNGEHFPVSLTISPVRATDGTIIGASKIARDISALKQISAEREQLLESERVARGRAERANQMKDEFLSTVSHELRTPLNAIVGWAQVLRDTAADHPENRDIVGAVEVIERNAHVQAQIIDDLLDLGRIAAGKMTLDASWIDVSKVIVGAIESVRHAAEQKQIEIRQVLSDVRGGMMADEKRLQQVVWNLLNNAIKFTPKGGRVTVTVGRINSHIELTVSDNGRGIAADFLPHVFERFRQADSSTTREYSGLGIGLSLVKQLVELHGGEVRAHSAGLGKGATFTVILPVMVARSEPQRSLDSSNEPSGEVDLTDVRVVALDDDPDSLQVIKRVLTSRGAQVELATSMEEGLEVVCRIEPDVILSDIGMPGHDGYEFIRRVRQLEKHGKIPAAALTALARSEDRMRALQAGYQTHVSKPVAPRELVAVVRSLADLSERRVAKT